MGIQSSGLWTDSFVDFLVDREQARCIRCQVCVNQCPYGANVYRAAADAVDSRHELCTGCRRCEAMCPTDCIAVRRHPGQFRPHGNWDDRHLKNAY
ncbi:MAG TPA: 4Fe-4S binding protein, partial [Candidatus Deferrimicrobiaceae bacterium]